MNVALITQARVGSSRLPGKVLKEINGETLLGIHLNRLISSRIVRHFVVATTTNVQDDAIEKIALESGWNCYRGSENNVLDRYYRSLPENEFEYVVRVTSDCPFVEGSIVDEVVQYTMDRHLDYCTNAIGHQYPDGIAVEVFSYQALKYSNEHATDKFDKEHVTLYMTRNSNLEGGTIFSGAEFPSNLSLGAYRVTVDKQNDFDLVEKLISQLGSKRPWMEYIDLMIKDKSLAAINQGTIKDEGYLNALEAEKRKDKKIL